MTQIAIINFLREKGISTSDELAKVTNSSVSNVCRKLGRLQDLGLVGKRRFFLKFGSLDHKLNFYFLKVEQANDKIAKAYNVFGESEDT